jgi:hypothetical protein
MQAVRNAAVHECFCVDPGVLWPLSFLWRSRDRSGRLRGCVKPAECRVWKVRRP